MKKHIKRLQTINFKKYILSLEEDIMNTLGSEKIGLQEIRSKHGTQSFMDVMGMFHLS